MSLILTSSHQILLLQNHHFPHSVNLLKPITHIPSQQLYAGRRGGHAIVFQVTKGAQFSPRHSHLFYLCIAGLLCHFSCVVSSLRYIRQTKGQLYHYGMTDIGWTTAVTMDLEKYRLPPPPPPPPPQTCRPALIPTRTP